MVAALLDLDADTCPGCGLPLSETVKTGALSKVELDKNLAEYFDSHPTERYVAGFVVCEACAALGKMQQAQREKDKKIIDGGGRVIAEARLWSVYQRPKPNN